MPALTIWMLFDPHALCGLPEFSDFTFRQPLGDFLHPLLRQFFFRRREDSASHNLAIGRFGDSGLAIDPL